MSLQRNLTEWQAAGLIDAATADAIAAHEARERRPLALWAVIGLGLLALALGIVLIVAAGWDRIPASLKLSGHLALTAAAAATAFRARPGSWLAEGALVLLAALTLAGLALHAQVWQLTGPLWALLGWWVLLMTPALLLAGSTRLTAYGWAAMLAALALSLFSDAPPLAETVPPALPPLLLLISALPLATPLFRRGLREAALVALLTAASVAHLAWSSAIDPAESARLLSRAPLAILVAVAAFAVVQDERAVMRTVLVATVAATLLAILPHPDGPLPRLLGALAFTAMWGAVARAADASVWRTLFGVAIAAIGLRILIVYFELFGGLATTGFGLVGGGALVIALTLGWRRIVRKNAA